MSGHEDGAKRQRKTSKNEHFQSTYSDTLDAVKAHVIDEKSLVLIARLSSDGRPLDCPESRDDGCAVGIQVDWPAGRAVGCPVGYIDVTQTPRLAAELSVTESADQ